METDVRGRIMRLAAAAGKAARLHTEGLREERDDAYVECLEQIDSLVDDIEKAMNSECGELPN